MWGATAAGLTAAGARPAAGRVSWRCGLRRHWPPSPCRGPAQCGLCLLVGGGGWCCCGSAAHATRSVAACIGGRPYRRLPQRRASPAPFFFADRGGLSVGWVSCSDVISGVEIVLWEGCYPAWAFSTGVFNTNALPHIDIGTDV